MAKHYYKNENLESDIVPMEKENQVPAPVPAQPTEKKKRTKVRVNVRVSPNGEIATIYEADTKVKVKKEENGWSELDNGLFIRSDLLR